MDLVKLIRRLGSGLGGSRFAVRVQAAIGFVVVWVQDFGLRG